MKATVVVENRPGGGGTVGTRAVAKAAPDGYTLMMAHTGTIAINHAFMPIAGYDPRKDFTAIGMIASMPVALIAHPSFPAKTVADVIAIAKKDPESSISAPRPSAPGAISPLIISSPQPTCRCRSCPIGYRAVDERPDRRACAGLVWGAAARHGQHPGRRVARIAVTGPRRFSLLPDVPTASESGLPGFDSVLLTG